MKNLSTYVYVILSIVVIVILSVLLYKSEKRTCSPYTPGWTGEELRAYYNTPNNTKDRSMCLCSSGAIPQCANKQILLSSYDEGNTEYQDFNITLGPPQWKNTNFDLY